VSEILCCSEEGINNACPDHGHTKWDVKKMCANWNAFFTGRGQVGVRILATQRVPKAILTCSRLMLHRKYFRAEEKVMIDNPTCPLISKLLSTCSSEDLISGWTWTQSVLELCPYGTRPCSHLVDHAHKISSNTGGNKQP